MSDYKNKINLMLGDSLPTIYDVGIDIFSYCTKPNSRKMKGFINAYSQALISQWTKAFGEEHVQASSTVKRYLREVVRVYRRKVYVEQSRTKSRHKGRTFVKKSLEELRKEWKQSTILIGKVHYIEQLFDIGKNMDSLTGDKASFYTEQLGSRCGRISDLVTKVSLFVLVFGNPYFGTNIYTFLV